MARSMQDGTMEEIEADTQALLHALFPGALASTQITLRSITNKSPTVSRLHEIIVA